VSDTERGVYTVRALTFHSGGLTLAADETVPAGPARGWVLLLHGGGQTRHSWARTGALLAGAGWRSIATDARGHGDSGWDPAGDYTTAAMARDIQAVVRQVGEPPVLMGASMGGMAALLAEGELAPLSRGVILADVVPRLAREGLRRIGAFMAAGSAGYATLDDAADALAALSPGRARRPRPDSIRRTVRRGDDGRWYWHWDPRLAPLVEVPERSVPLDRAFAAAGRMRVPTLLIRGSASDVVTADGADELCRLIPGAVARETNAGHMVTGDDNDMFSRHVLEFLADLPAAPVVPAAAGGAAALPPIPSPSASLNGEEPR
jgi:pimeloyl-ACP methyl ester carboxylesterase